MNKENQHQHLPINKRCGSQRSKPNLCRPGSRKSWNDGLEHLRAASCDLVMSGVLVFFVGRFSKFDIFFGEGEVPSIEHETFW